MGNAAICLDTNILIYFLRKREPGTSAVKKAVQENQCYVTAITVYELKYGVARSKKEIGESILLRMMTVLPLTEHEASLAAQVHVDLIRNNQNIGINDVMIAATCLHHKIPLLTANLNHFQRVPNLQVISPEEFLRK